MIRSNLWFYPIQGKPVNSQVCRRTTAHFLPTMSLKGYATTIRFFPEYLHLVRRNIPHRLLPLSPTPVAHRKSKWSAAVTLRAGSKRGTRSHVFDGRGSG